MLYTIRCLRCETTLGWGNIQPTKLSERTEAYCEKCAPPTRPNALNLYDQEVELRKKLASGQELKKHDLRLMTYLQIKAARAGKALQWLR